MDRNNLKYKKLFEDKKYSELIFLIESIKDEKNLSAGEHNLLGATRLLIEKNEKNILLSLHNFETAYLKEKTTQIGLGGLTNYTNLIVDLFKISNQEVNFSKTISYYKEAIFFFKYDRNLMVAIKRLYWRLNEVDKIHTTLSEMIKNQDYSSDTICSYIFSQHYSDNWSQKKFLDYSNNLQEKLTNYKLEKFAESKFIKNRKIKLGFLTGDIRSNHSVTYFLKTVLLNYDEKKYEIYLYFNHENDDETTEEFKKLVFKTKNIDGLKDLEAINYIRNDNIDIAFDLMGATSSHREVLFKNRISPKQVIWIGYCNTMGLGGDDYIIADPNLIYDNEKQLYSEKIIYLPKIWNCHSGFNSKRTFLPSPYKQNEFITFGSFNNFCKVTDKVVETWSQILQKVKNSRLILKSSGKTSTARLKKLFKDNQVLDSVIFHDHIKLVSNHLKLYNEIDIALDTFPYNGVTTSFEATWMSVPVLTMKGYNFNSRCGESINKNLDLHNLIARDRKDYVNKAFELSQNLDQLNQIKNNIFKNALTSPLFNVQLFSDNFFKAIKNIYNNN